MTEHADAEREALLQQVRDLQAELDAITPLRRHLLREARRRLDRTPLRSPVVPTPPELLPGESAPDYDARALAALRVPEPERVPRVRASWEDAARRTAKRVLGR